MTTNQWITDYVRAQKAALDSIPPEAVAQLFKNSELRSRRTDRFLFLAMAGVQPMRLTLQPTWARALQIRWVNVFGSCSLADNVSWLTALGNDYAYEDVFVRQLHNYAKPG